MTKAPLRLLLALALLVGACVAPAAEAPFGSDPASAAPRGSPVPPALATSAAQTAAAADMTAILRAKSLPAADIFSITRRVRGRSGSPATPFEPARLTAPSEPEGAAEQFFVYDFSAKRNDRVRATLRLLTPNAKWWVADGVTVDLAKLRETADFFEARIYPTNRRFYGSEWSPGIDADPRVNILLANIPGAAAGYFSISDEQPRWINEFSAEREILYLNALSARLGSSGLHSVIAHEFCHMIQANRRVQSVVWFVEGQAQLCETANGLGTGFEVAFLRRPDTQLDDWPDLDNGAAASYGSAYLFLEFLRQKAGGEELINAFLAHGVQTPDDLDRVLQARGQSTVEALYADFVAANALIGTNADDRFTYTGSTAPRTAALVSEQDRVTASGTVRATVHNFAARYIEVPRARLQLRFNGARASRVIPTDPHSGTGFWWSDRGDAYDATLTRRVDLRGQSTAALSFWTWYEIEKEYDYAYVEASIDDGVTWKTLRATGTTEADPLGHNLGQGYTNVSGGGKDKPVWVQERVDLTPFAGREILLRFEYVTDEGRALGGFALDDLELSTGFRDDMESIDAGWTASGFVRSTNVVLERWAVQVIRFQNDRATVERHLVSGAELELDFDATGDRRPPLIAVTPFSVRSVDPVPFELSVEVRK